MVTLRELASALGVHASTVSRVLNGHRDARLSEATRARILALAAETGYRPNRLARSLKTQRTHLLGVLVPDIANPFFAVLLRAVEDAARGAGCNVILCNTDDEPARCEQHLRVLGEGHVDGLLIATAHRDDPHITRLRGTRLPYVLVNRRRDDPNDSWVITDDRGGARQAVRHLAALGHTRIAHIHGPRDVSTTAARLAAYTETLAELGLPRQDEWAVDGGLSETGGERGMAALLALPAARRPTAVFAANDLAALGAMNVARAAGLRVPADLSVVGYNDLPLAARLTPALTTVRVPHYELGRQASEVLLRLLAGAPGAAERPVQIVLPTNLVVRDSTSAPPARGAAARPSRRTRSKRPPDTAAWTGRRATKATA